MSDERSPGPLDAATPWYRQRWPWFLIALPASAVIGSAITAVLAVRTFDGPVAADYYKQGLAINHAGTARWAALRRDVRRVRRRTADSPAA